MSKQWYCPQCGPDVAVVHWGGAYGGVRCAECKAHAQSEPPDFVTVMRHRIAELETVAAAAIGFNEIAKMAANTSFTRWEEYVRIQSDLEKALCEAGYPKEQG